MEANLKFHHKGKFEKNGYVGGEETLVMGVDLDKFSYTVLTEFVKDELGYTEIGGVYSWKGPMSGWKLVTNDADLGELMQVKNSGDYIDFYVDTVVDDKIEPMKQMQPHVIVRPRKNLLTPAAKSQKRQFVTTHHLQQAAKNKKQTEVFTPRKSARLHNPLTNETQTDHVFSPRKSARLNNPLTNETQTDQVFSPRKLARRNNPQVSEAAVHVSPRMNRKKVISKKSTGVNRSTKLPEKNPTEVGSSTKIAEKENTTEVLYASLNNNSGGVRSKLEFYNSPDEDENTDENEILDDGLPPPPLTEYERERAKHVSQKNSVFEALGMPKLVTGLRNEFEKNKGKSKMPAESEDYGPEEEEPSEDDTSQNPLKRTKKVKVTMPQSGPTTRSRANAESATDMNATPKAGENPVPTQTVDPPCSAELPHNEGIGTMAAYLAMREHQKNNSGGSARKKAVVGNVSTNIENEEDEVQEGEVVGAPRRLRGKTKMDNVHSRSYDKRVIIQMNHRGQPVSDDDKVLSELSAFLGTLKRSVPLTYKSWFDVPSSLKGTLWNYVKQRYIIPDECEYWVLKSIRDSWRGYKSRIKKAHYTAYETDEERLANRPDEIPLADFKVLLMYWGDEKIQSKALTNCASRKSYTDTHTAGPKLFSQIRHKMSNESDGELFVKTRKRKEGKVYKTDTSVIKYRLDKIEKAIGEGGSDGVVQDMISDGKSHGPSWLIGRHTKSAEVSKDAPTTSTYIQELAAKIRENIVDEVEAKVNKKVQTEFDAKVNQKVKENLTWVLKKLGEANPDMQIDVGDLCATVCSDDIGTGGTGGSQI